MVNKTQCFLFNQTCHWQSTKLWNPRFFDQKKGRREGNRCSKLYPYQGHLTLTPPPPRNQGAFFFFGLQQKTVENSSQQVNKPISKQQNLQGLFESFHSRVIFLRKKHLCIIDWRVIWRKSNINYFSTTSTFGSPNSLGSLSSLQRLA